MAKNTADTENSAKKQREGQSLEICFVGHGLDHSISPPIHNQLCKDLGLKWQFVATECPSIEDCVQTFQSSRVAGGVVTMPWKSKIIPHLDGGVDEVASALGAVNAVFFDEAGRLKGGNVDWVGIEGSLKEAGVGLYEKPTIAGLIGAGGAARAAAYALIRSFQVKEIYILNRDDAEVESLMRDCEEMVADSLVSLVHVKTEEQARRLESPTLIVGTVPDLKPDTAEEKSLQAILESFLARGTGVLLDMCYKPRITRHIALASQYGWRTVQGTAVVGHMIEALWRLWVTDETLKRLDRAMIWQVLEEEAERSIHLNPSRGTVTAETQFDGD
jgi:quinate dehydrogenase